MTAPAQPNAFYARCVLAAHGAPRDARTHDYAALPHVRTPYGARAWRSPYTFLTAPRAAAGAAGDAWRTILSAEATPPGLLRLELLPRDAQSWQPFAEACTALGLAHALVRGFERPMLDTAPDWPALEARLSRQRRRNLRRAEAGLAARGRLRFARATHPVAVAEAFDVFCAIERSGWKGRAGTALGQHPADALAFGNALGAMAQEDAARVHTLLVDERPVAAGIVLLDAPHAFYAKIAYDEAFARASPGVALSAEVTRGLIAEPGITLADSCSSEGNDMIAWMWPDRRPLADVVVATRPAIPRTAVEAAARALRAAYEAREAVKWMLGRR